MSLSGHHLARGVRLVAWAMVSLLGTVSPLSLAFAQAPMPAAPPAQPPAAPIPALPPPATPVQDQPLPPAMTLDQAAPPVTLAPAPPGQGTITRIVVQGTQRIEPDSVLSYMLLREGQAYDPAVADRSLKALFDTGLFADVRMSWDGATLTVNVVENPIL